jgi:multisubunit Na+/H+ antiporter MnhB subunit
MNDFPWILVAISLGLILVLLAVAVLRRRKEPRHIDYRNYFVMGIIWLAFTPVMILLPWILHGEEPSLGFSFFFVMGLAYVIIGLRNRDKWGKKVEVSTTASRNMIGIIGVLVLIFILGIVVLTLYG